jgi:hypothetical protein
MASRMFRAIVVAGAALAEACGSSDKEPPGSWGLASFGVHDGGRVPASPSVSREPDAAAAKAATDALVDGDATPDANAAVIDGMEGDASSRPDWGSILVK